MQSPLMVGGRTNGWRAGLISAIVAGSIAVGGSFYTDRDQAAVVNNFYGTGAYLSYDDVPCTNTGGLAKYTSCSWQNTEAQTGALMRVQVDSYKAPNASPVTCVTSSDGTATGQVLFKYIATASGRSVFSHPQPGSLTNNGSGSLAVLVPPNHYVRCWHSTTPGVGLKEQLRVWFNKLYVP